MSASVCSSCESRSQCLDVTGVTMSLGQANPAMIKRMTPSSAVCWWKVLSSSLSPRSSPVMCCQGTETIPMMNSLFAVAKVAEVSTEPTMKKTLEKMNDGWCFVASRGQRELLRGRKRRKRCRVTNQSLHLYSSRLCWRIISSNALEHARCSNFVRLVYVE